MISRPPTPYIFLAGGMRQPPSIGRCIKLGDGGNFTNHPATTQNCGLLAAIILPYLDYTYGNPYQDYRMKLLEAVLESGGDPIALAESDPSGKSLLKAIPRGHLALDACPPKKGEKIHPFDFCAATGEILGQNPVHVHYCARTLQ